MRYETETPERPGSRRRIPLHESQADRSRLDFPRWHDHRVRCIVSDEATRSAEPETTEEMNQEDAANLMGRYLRKEATPEDMADLLIPPAAVDLRAVPKAEWSKSVMVAVKLPDDVRAFVEGQQEFTREELDRLEDRIATFYGVTEPFYITCEMGAAGFEAWLGKSDS